MKKLIQVDVETFKYGFSALYSSIDSAIALLPKHPDWDGAFGFMMRTFSEVAEEKGELYRYMDRDLVKKSMKLEWNSVEQKIQLFATGPCVSHSWWKDYPEVRIPGELFVPARREKVDETIESFSGPIFYFYHKEVYLDEEKT